MKTTLTEIFAVIIVLAVLVLVGFSAAYQGQSDQKEIKDWCKQNNYSVWTVEPCRFVHPFWFCNEEDRIYKVTLTDSLERHRTMWVKYSVFGGIDRKWE